MRLQWRLTLYHDHKGRIQLAMGDGRELMTYMNETFAQQPEWPAHGTIAPMFVPPSLLHPALLGRHDDLASTLQVSNLDQLLPTILFVSRVPRRFPSFSSARQAGPRRRPFLFHLWPVQPFTTFDLASSSLYAETLHSQANPITSRPRSTSSPCHHARSWAG